MARTKIPAPRVEPITVHCAVCKTVGEAFVVTTAPGIGGAKWLSLPARWWMLTECLTLHVRCPRCLRAKGAA
jgi:hypothetical protein